MSKDDKNNQKKKVTIKYKDLKEGGEPKTYELEVKDEEQKVDDKRFKDVKSNVFRTAYKIYTGGKDDKSGNDWTPKTRLEWASYISIVVGVIALICGVYFFFFRKKKNKREEEVL